MAGETGQALRDKIMGLSYAPGGRPGKPKVTTATAEDGTRTKTTTIPEGSQTEHSKPGSGVSHRLDALVTPQTVRWPDRG